MGLDGLRAGAEAFLRSGGRGAKGGRKVNWRQRWEIPMKDSTDPRGIAEPAIFVDAEYEDAYLPGMKRPYYHYRVHNFNQGTKAYFQMICSSGPDGRGNCVGCWLYSQGKKWAEPKDKVAFNIAHLGWYHDTPLLDKQTNQIVYKQNEPGVPIIVRAACEAQAGNLQCKWCQAGYQRIFGGHRYIEVGPGHLESIQGIDKALQATCINCKTGVLTPETAYRCPDCKTVAYEIATSGFTTQEQIHQYNFNHQPCRQCSSTNPFEPAYECGYVQGQKMGGGCAPGQTKVATLFDTVLFLHREKGKLVTLKNEHKVAFSDFRAPEGGRTPEDILAEIKTPFDFADTFKPEDTDSQAKRAGVPNPYGPAVPAFQSYPGPAAWQQGQQPVPPPQQQYPQFQGQNPPQQYPQQNMPPQVPQQPVPQWQQPGQVPPPPPPPSPGVPGAPPRPFGR
jgi:hypothetical protein